MSESHVVGRTHTGSCKPAISTEWSKEMVYSSDEMAKVWAIACRWRSIVRQETICVGLVVRYR